jgi:hypothetical protein
MKRAYCAVLSVLLATSAGLAAPATAPSTREIFNNTEPIFILHLPKDFKEPADKKALPNMLYFWEQKDDQDHKTNVYVGIETIHQELPQAPVEKPDNVDKMYTEKWQGWDINVYVIHTKTKNENGEEQLMVTRNAAVPLQGSALKLQVTGPAASDVQMDALLKDLLGNLEGKTNWMVPEDHSTRMLLSGLGLGAALVAIAVVLIVRQRQWKNRNRDLAAIAARQIRAVPKQVPATQPRTAAPRRDSQPARRH